MLRAPILVALLLVPAGALLSRPGVAQTAQPAAPKGAFTVVTAPGKPFAIAPVRAAPQDGAQAPRRARLSPPTVYYEPQQAPEPPPEAAADEAPRPAARRAPPLQTGSEPGEAPQSDTAESDPSDSDSTETPAPAAAAPAPDDQPEG